MTDNIIEICNESTVLIVLTILLGYTDGQMDPLVGSNIGFFLVALILFNILGNVVLFICASIRVIYYKFLRRLYYKLCVVRRVSKYSEVNVTSTIVAVAAEPQVVTVLP